MDYDALGCDFPLRYIAVREDLDTESGAVLVENLFYVGNRYHFSNFSFNCRSAYSAALLSTSNPLASTLDA